MFISFQPKKFDIYFLLYCSSLYVIQKEALFCWLDSNFITLVFKFEDRPLVMHHLLVLSSSIKDLDWTFWISGPEIGMSVMYSKNSNGPRMEPSPGVLHFLLFPNLKKFYQILYAISQLFVFCSPNKIWTQVTLNCGYHNSKAYLEEYHGLQNHKP